MHVGSFVFENEGARDALLVPFILYLFTSSLVLTSLICSSNLTKFKTSHLIDLRCTSEQTALKISGALLPYSMVASIFNATCFSPTSALIPLVGLLPEVTLSANSLKHISIQGKDSGTLLAVIPAIFSNYLVIEC